MNSSFSWETTKIEAERLPSDDGGDEVADRQDRLPGFSTAALAKSQVLLIGAGGLAGCIAPALVRKGIGWLDIVDHDVVEVSNLNRQRFYADDLYRPKAHRLAEHAAREGQLGSTVMGHYTAFGEETAPILAEGASVAVCAVDNNQTRAIASTFFRQRRIPVIFTAVNETADFGWVFVQQADGPCVACVFPRVAEAASEPQQCRPVPAVIDILQVMGGLVLYAIDTLVMERQRSWNFRSVHLVGSVPEVVDRVPQRSDCPLCRPLETLESNA